MVSQIASYLLTFKKAFQFIEDSLWITLNAIFQYLKEGLKQGKKKKSSGSADKRKLESDIQELKSTLSETSRIKEDGQKQLEKYQNQLGDMQRGLDDAKQSQEDLNNQVKQNEMLVVRSAKKLKLFR